MFPDLNSNSSFDLIVYSNMKDFILSLAEVNWSDEWEVEQIQSKINAVVCQEEAREITAEYLERNFYNLCGLMEEKGSNSPQNYSIIQFYSKLSYINEKAKQEKEAHEGIMNNFNARP